MTLPPLELTTRFAGISTADNKSPTRLTPEAATQRAYAHMRYIDRENAVASRVIFGVPGDNLEAQGKAFRAKIAERSNKGGRRGARVAERAIFSLPNNLSGDDETEILRAILQRLIPNDSDASGWAVVHADKPNNRHCHMLLVDGLESREAAMVRMPDAKRVRRADVIRMGEFGRPKELRRIIAEEINRVASKSNARSVEWRSFKARGIQKTPTRHKGPRRLAQTAREAVSSIIGWLTSSTLGTPISELFPDTTDSPPFLGSFKPKRAAPSHEKVRDRQNCQ